MAYAMGELALLLLCICIYLLMHIRSLKSLIAKLEEKITSLRNTIALTKENAKQLIQDARGLDAKAYVDYIEDQLENTRNYHLEQSPDKDIVLDLDIEVSIERQAAALRHAFLIAEKEANYAGDEDEPSWEVIRLKLEQIISFYEHAFSQEEGEELGEKLEGEAEEEVTADEPVPEDAAPSEELNRLQEELNNYKKRVDNLEKFKKLFFDMENKWDTARKEAQGYYDQLKAMAAKMESGEDFNNVLDSYSRSYELFDDSFAEGRSIEGGSVRVEDSIDDQTRPVGTTQIIVSNKEEVERLRSMMYNQHEIISELKRQLRESESEEDKAQIVDNMTEELEKQERFLKESETCIQLLEEELSAAHKEAEQLSTELKALKAGGVDGAVVSSGGRNEEEVNEMIEGYVSESREMLNSISILEQENQQLKDQLAMGDIGGEASSEEANTLRDKLSEVQQELLNLQTQHIELEERYIELKTSMM